MRRWMLTAALSAALTLPSFDVRAGFSPEQLGGHEITEIQATVTTVIPDEKVLEIEDPQGHTEVLTVGTDLTPLALQAGDRVQLSILDGLIVDLEPSREQELSFSREDIILPMDMGQMKKDMRVALASGTARVIRIDRQDRSISLMGPLGGIHNLDVLSDQEVDGFAELKTGDLVDFRLIQPMALSVSKLPPLSLTRVATPAPKAPVRTVRPPASLKSELLESFEFAHLNGTVTKVMDDGQAFVLRGPEGHAITLSAGLDLDRTGLRRGDQVGVDLLEGLVVDLLPSTANQLTITSETVLLASPFGPVPRGSRVTVVTGTAEVIRIARKDHTISLRGPDGHVHNLDLRQALEEEALPDLQVGDVVAFRLIQPIAYAIQRQSAD